MQTKAKFATAITLLAMFVMPGTGTATATNPDEGGEVVVHRLGPRPSRGAQAYPRIRPQLSRVGHTAIEPTLGITNNGDVFFSTFEASTRVNVLRSRNDGKSWDVVSPSIAGQNAHLLSADPYVHVDHATDRVFTIDLTVACSFLSFSDDHGETWTTNPLACGRPVNDHQTLFTGPAAISTPVGYEQVVYYCFSDFAQSACSKSLDGGITFAPTGSVAFPVELKGSGNPCPGWHGHGVVDSNGIVYLPKAQCNEPWIAISRDEGLTWERVRVAGHELSNGGADPAVAVDRAGNLYYVWVGRDRLPYMSVSRDEGRTWSRPLAIGSPRVTEANLVTVAAGGKGSIAIAYAGSENSLYRECGGPQGCAGRDITPVTPTWNGYLAISTNAAAPRPRLYTARINHLRDPLVEGRCGPGRCPAMLDFIDVQIAPDGNAWASFVDGYIPTGAKGDEFEGLAATLVGAPPLR